MYSDGEIAYLIDVLLYFGGVSLVVRPFLIGTGVAVCATSPPPEAAAVLPCYCFIFLSSVVY